MVQGRRDAAGRVQAYSFQLRRSDPHSRHADRFNLVLQAEARWPRLLRADEQRLRHQDWQPAGGIQRKEKDRLRQRLRASSLLEEVHHDQGGSGEGPAVKPEAKHDRA